MTPPAPHSAHQAGREVGNLIHRQGAAHAPAFHTINDRGLVCGHRDNSQGWRYEINSRPQPFPAGEKFGKNSALGFGQ